MVVVFFVFFNFFVHVRNHLIKLCPKLGGEGEAPAPRTAPSSCATGLTVSVDIITGAECQ